MMNVYLVRHGDAVGSEVDPQNPLSELGRKQVSRLGDFLAPLNIQASYLFHSKKLRAQQTAEILAKAIQFKGVMETHPGLQPQDLVSPIASEINQAEDNMIYVGHMPFMAKLAAKLITGSEDRDIILFQTATMACLERMGSDTWLLKWLICPELVR